jgi:hypothetical protein
MGKGDFLFCKAAANGNGEGVHREANCQNQYGKNIHGVILGSKDNYLSNKLRVEIAGGEMNQRNEETERQ